LRQLGERLSEPEALWSAVLAYTVFNPIGSPQFAVPVVALAAMAGVGERGSRGARALTFAYAALTGLAFTLYVNPPQVSLAFGFVTLARNLALLSLWASVLFWPRREDTRDPPAWTGDREQSADGGSSTDALAPGRATEYERPAECSSSG